MMNRKFDDMIWFLFNGLVLEGKIKPENHMFMVKKNVQKTSFPVKFIINRSI